MTEQKFYRTKQEKINLGCGLVAALVLLPAFVLMLIFGTDDASIGFRFIVFGLPGPLLALILLVHVLDAIERLIIKAKGGA